MILKYMVYKNRKVIVCKKSTQFVVYKDQGPYHMQMKSIVFVPALHKCNFLFVCFLRGGSMQEELGTHMKISSNSVCSFHTNVNCMIGRS